LNQLKNIIEFSPIVSNCPSQELTAALTQSKYFRIRNGILDLYDSKVGLSMEFIFANPYDASKPMFPAAASTSSAPKATPAANSQPSTSSIAGNWAIAALFNIPLPSTSYNLTISPTTIRINGGCNTYTYQYTINSTSQLIAIGNQTSTNKSCGQSDDQLYVSGILKMYKYLISGSNGIFTLRFYDQTGNPGYTLSINQNQGAQGSQAKSVQPSSSSQTPQPSERSDNRAMS
jgi:heat shock protein HslJ